MIKFRESQIAEAADFYQRFGYVVISELLSSREVALLESEISSTHWSVGDEGVVRGVQRIFDKHGLLRLVKIPELSQRSYPVKKLLLEGKVGGVAKFLLGGEARLYRDVVIVKPAHTGGRFNFHQDSAYWNVEPAQLVSAWIPTSSVSDDESPLEVIDSSHKLGVRKHDVLILGRLRLPRVVTKLLMLLSRVAGTGDNPSKTARLPYLWKIKTFLVTRVPTFFDLTNISLEVDNLKTHSLPVEMGDVVFFHSCLIHGTRPNHSQKTRISEIASYMAAESTIAGQLVSDFPLVKSHVT